MAELNVAALVEAHHADIWRYLRYLGCDRALADDLTQETFVRILEQPFEQRSRLETTAYLRTVSRNLFLMHHRAGKLVRTVAELDAADAAWERAHADEGDDRQHALRECIEALQGKARQAVHLQYTEKRSGEQIAGALGITHANLRVLLHRTREALRKCIESKLKGGRA